MPFTASLKKESQLRLVKIHNTSSSLTILQYFIIAHTNTYSAFTFPTHSLYIGCSNESHSYVQPGFDSAMILLGAQEVLCINGVSVLMPMGTIFNSHYSFL